MNRATEQARQPALSPMATEALRASALPGNDQAQWVGDKYSPNLLAWLSKNRRGQALPTVYRDSGGATWIGWIDELDWFAGCGLMAALCWGRRQQVYAYAPEHLTLTPVEGFWDRYDAIGRCAIDEAHSVSFIGEETRWSVLGNTRSCLWCGNHRQHLRRWEETVQREEWEAASADTHPKGGDALAAPFMGSAVPEADAPEPAASRFNQAHWAS